LLGCLLGVLLGTCAPAFALSQRGHEFSFAFGSKGQGADEFEHPSGIAVNDTTGDVYVADRGNNRVLELEPQGEGTPKEIKSLSVPYPVDVAVDNSTEAGDPSAQDVYVIGETAAEAKELQPEETPEVLIVYKFSRKGALIAQIKKFKAKVKIRMGKEIIEEEEFEEELEEVKGVAVGTDGSLYVDQDEAILKFDNASKNKGVALIETGEAGEVRPGLALDTEGNLYVGLEEVGAIAEEGGSVVEEEETEHAQEEDEEVGLIPEAQFDRIAEGKDVTKGVESELQITVPEFDPQYTPAVAVNPIDEAHNEVDELNAVYVANVIPVGGEAVSTVAAFNAQHELVQRFGAEGLKDAEGIAVDSHTGTVYVADAASDRVDVFALEQEGPPTVGALSSCTAGGGAGCPIAAGVTQLRAKIEPHGSDTHYHFEYGPGPCPSECTSTSEQDAGGGYAERTVTSAEEIASLPAGTYDYRVVAINAHGEVDSVEKTFTILASAAALPDGRGWELVSPPHKDGAEAEPLTITGGGIRAAEDGGAMAYIGDGPMGAVVEGSRNPEATQFLAIRGSSGWSDSDIATPNNTGLGLAADIAPEYQDFSPNLALALVEPFAGGEHATRFAGPPLSPPLSTQEKALAAEGKPYQEKTIYLRDDAPLAPAASEAETYEQAQSNGAKMENPGYVALVSEPNAPGHEPFGGGYNVGNEGIEFLRLATPDLSHVVVGAREGPSPLLPGPASGLYEWSEGAEGEALQPVSVLPGPAGTVLKMGEAVAGGPHGWNTRNAISSDGTRVFWTGSVANVRHLYLRDTATKETLQLDQVAAHASGGGEDAPIFQTASADGSKVFFTDAQKLTRLSKARNGASDLYVFELGDSAAAPECEAVEGGRLCDLTPEGESGESAEVQAQGAGGGVLGASEDGSYVYFVANAALASGASPGDCEVSEAPPGMGCNLYVRHYNGSEEKWEATKLVGELSEEDQPDWDGNGHQGVLTYMSSRVSPDGQYLAFMSKRPLTGYDNVEEDKSTGPHADEEVFLYDAASETLTCTSCRPDRLPPAEGEGIYDEGENPKGGGTSLLIDGPQIWGARGNYTEGSPDPWLAGLIPGWTAMGDAQGTYQSRYLSNSGRLFFDSPGDLVEAAHGDEPKVYEYEPADVGSCQSAGGCVGLISAPEPKYESAFLDASADGNEVFFLTAERLVPQDTDESFDVYDAHVCEASSPCFETSAASSPVCDSTAGCRPGEFSEEAYGAPASTGAGSGNIGHVEVIGEKVFSPPLTLTQKLADALKACKADKRKSARLACEKQARAKYEPLIRAQELASALKVCKHERKKSSRLQCERQARTRFAPRKAAKAGKSAAKGKGR
jgi:DNA-binding beta-propeller fold protein YncE